MEAAQPLSDQALADAINSLPGEKVTLDAIERRITGCYFAQLPDSTVTICHLTLENGYSVRGESACVDPANFRADVGQQLAYKDAVSKLWPLEGYLLAERRWRAARNIQ